MFTGSDAEPTRQVSRQVSVLTAECRCHVRDTTANGQYANDGQQHASRPRSQRTATRHSTVMSVSAAAAADVSNN